MHFVPGYVLCYPAIFAMNRPQAIGSKTNVKKANVYLIFTYDKKPIRKKLERKSHIAAKAFR
jgi:hypothetical protein